MTDQGDPIRAGVVVDVIGQSAVGHPLGHELERISGDTKERDDVWVSQSLPHDGFLEKQLQRPRTRFSNKDDPADGWRNARTFLRPLVSFRATLNTLMQTLLPPWSPCHTSAKPPYAIALTPILERSPLMMCEDGKVAWVPQTARNLRRHRRKISSVVGMEQRAFEVSFAAGRKGEGRGRT